jgi:Tfp pilus assembly protein PilF
MAVIVMGRLTPLIGVMLLVLTGLASTAHADARSDAKEQVRFGIRVAQRGLWQEALYRWKRATEIDPSYAEAFNNLAIAHENQGQLEEAREAYERAIELAPDNTMILQNYDLFKEINERANRRQS